MAKPIVEELSPELLISVIFQALADELPQAPMTIESIEEEIAKYSNYLEKNHNAHYDPATHDVVFNGEVYNYSNNSLLCLINHYNTYQKDNDLVNAGLTLEKIHHFFPDVVLSIDR